MRALAISPLPALLPFPSYALIAASGAASIRDPLEARIRPDRTPSAGRRPEIRAARLLVPELTSRVQVRDRPRRKGAIARRMAALLGLSLGLVGSLATAVDATPLTEFVEHDESGQPTGHTLLFAHAKEGGNGLSFVARCVDGSARYSLVPWGFLAIAAEREGYATIRVDQNVPLDLEIRDRNGTARLIPHLEAHLRKQILQSDGEIRGRFEARHGRVLLVMDAPQAARALRRWETGKGCTPKVNEHADNERETWLRSELPEWHGPA